MAAGLDPALAGATANYSGQAFPANRLVETVLCRKCPIRVTCFHRPLVAETRLRLLRRSGDAVVAALVVCVGSARQADRRRCLRFVLPAV